MSDLRPFKSVETCFMTKRMFSPGECSMVVCREYLSVCCWVKGSMSISYIMQVVITFVFYILTDSLSVTKKTLRSIHCTPASPLSSGIEPSITLNNLFQNPSEDSLFRSIYEQISPNNLRIPGFERLTAQCSNMAKFSSQEVQGVGPNLNPGFPNPSNIIHLMLN